MFAPVSSLLYFSQGCATSVTLSLSLSIIYIIILLVSGIDTYFTLMLIQTIATVMIAKHRRHFGCKSRGGGGECTVRLVYS